MTQEDKEMGQVLSTVQALDGRLSRMEGKFDLLDNKIDGICLDASKRQRECWEILHRDLVSRVEFQPVKHVAYTLVSAACLAILGGLISLVVRG
jgi:hypothetical protein